MATNPVLFQVSVTPCRMKGRKKLLLPIAVLLALALCVLLLYTSYEDSIAEKYALSPSQEIPQDPELIPIARQLRRVRSKDHTLIFATVTEAWTEPGSVFHLFLESFRIGEQTQALLKHVVIIATDRKAMDRCKQKHPNCYMLAVDGVDLSGSEKKFMTVEYLAIIWERLHFLGKVLKLGYNIIISDTDVMWLRSPFRHFSPEDDITISCDHYTGNSYDLANRVNAGFLFVRSNNRTIRFFEHWHQLRSQYPNMLDQTVFDIIKRSEFTKNLGVRMRFLDTAIFGGFCEHGRDLNKLCTLHATCCVGMDRKIHDLRVVLDVWRNFSSLSEAKKREGFSWRVPIECRM